MNQTIIYCTIKIILSLVENNNNRLRSVDSFKIMIFPILV